MSNEEKPKGRFGWRFWLILILVLILTIGGAATGTILYLGGKIPGEEKEKAVPVYQAPMGNFTVNLKDNNYKRYLRMELTLETNEKKLIKEIEENNHRIRDVIIVELAGKSVADLENREELKDELMNAINAILTKGEVSGIYFAQFMFQ